MMFRDLRHGALLLAVAMVTAGCFAGSAVNGGDDATRLRLVLPFPPVQAWSPWGDDALLLTRLGIAEPLVDLDAGGSPRPGLAESWVRTGDRSWRFRLRPGVKFHSGAVLTAPDAVNALLEAAAASPMPRALKGVGLAASAEGERDFVVTTARPDPVLPQRLSSPNLVILARSAYRSGRADPAGAATGPFVLKNARSAKDTATLEAFTAYWAGAPRSAGVDIRFVPDGTARAGALRADEADIVGALPVAATADPAQVRTTPLPRTVSLHLNTAKAPFSDVGLRAAVRAAVDPAGLARGVYEGQADVARGIYGPASPWASPARGRSPVRSPAVPGGQHIVLATYADRAELPEAGSAVAEALRTRGFVVEQVVREYSLLEPDLLAGRFDAVLSSRSYLLDTGDPFAYLLTDWTCQGSYNLSRLCDPAIDTAIAEAALFGDPKAREAAALKIEAAVLATDAMVPLVHERARLGIAAGVADIPADPFERHLLAHGTRRS